MRTLAVIILAALLLGFAPLPREGARRQTRQPCTEANAAFVRRAWVERTAISNGTQIQVPIGYAVGWSCKSAELADAELERQFERIGGGE